MYRIFWKAGVFLLLLSCVLSPDMVWAQGNMANECVMEEEETEPGRADVTVWRYRYVNGRKQKRLWSVTEGKWLTAWMWT